jgi:hypothetical protein
VYQAVTNLPSPQETAAVYGNLTGQIIAADIAAESRTESRNVFALGAAVGLGGLATKYTGIAGDAFDHYFFTLAPISAVVGGTFVAVREHQAIRRMQLLKAERQAAIEAMLGRRPRN